MITKLNRWSCMACAFARALGISEEEFNKAVGHDGSEIAFEGLPEPLCRRGFHIQECIDVCLSKRKSVTPIELFPVINSQDVLAQVAFGQNYPKGNFRRFHQHVREGSGVITGMGRRSGHALSVCRGVLYDPDNADLFWYSEGACEERGFYPQCFWRVS